MCQKGAIFFFLFCLMKNFKTKKKFFSIWIKFYIKLNTDGVRKMSDGVGKW